MTTYPDAPRVVVVDQLHGRPVADPYRWLEDRDSPATESWLEAESQLFAEHASRWASVPHFRQRIETFLSSGSIGPPVWRGLRFFQMVREPGQDHAVLYVIEANGHRRELLNPNELDPTGLTTLDSWQPTKEGGRLAYQLSVGGNEESQIYVLDVESGQQLEGPIDRARYSPIAWMLGGQAYYYVRRLPPEQLPDGEQQFHRRVWLHKVGEDPANDVLIFGDGRKHTEYYGVGVSRDGRWLTISASEGTAPRNDLWVADLFNCDPANVQLQPIQIGIDAQSGLQFGRDGRVYVFTDRDAPRGRLCVTDVDTLTVEHWRDLVPEDPGAVLADYAILDGGGLADPVLLLSWTRHAVGAITIHELNTGKRIGEIELPGVGTIGGLVERPEGGSEVWFVYTDSATVPRILHFDAVTRELTVAYEPPGFVEVPQIRSTMKVYHSLDGTEVQLILLSPTNATVDKGRPTKPRPTVLYGYGGFSIPMAPAYAPSILAWVEAGGVYAIACIRGGSEEGERWHRDGMLGSKQNVYDDFIAAAQWLIDNGWTTSEQLAISGGSNGGLLVGAVMTQRPDLMAGVHCSAPLLDMIRYEHSGLGATWNVEYGSAAKAEEFAWLWSYSPYHRVREGVKYPMTLFSVFDQDTRVDPMHARKMCAALQYSTSGDRPILLRSEAEVGHGARSVSRSVDLSADVLAFLAEATGLSKEINS